MQYTPYNKKTSESITETARQTVKNLEDMLKQQHALELARAFSRGHDAGWQSAIAHLEAQRGWCSGCNPDNCSGCGGVPEAVDGFSAHTQQEPVDYLTCDIDQVCYMDIYSPPGTKVVFHGLGGYNNEKVCAEKSLVLGNTYTVQYIDVGRSSSTVKLQEVEGDFNTVLFGPAGQKIQTSQYENQLAIKLKQAKLKEALEFNKKIRDNVDSLLAQAGFDEESSVRNQLSCMNFDVLQQLSNHLVHEPVFYEVMNKDD